MIPEYVPAFDHVEYHRNGHRLVLYNDTLSYMMPVKEAREEQARMRERTSAPAQAVGLSEHYTR